jgi:hypothetical protein
MKPLLYLIVLCAPLATEAIEVYSGSFGPGSDNLFYMTQTYSMYYIRVWYANPSKFDGFYVTPDQDGKFSFGYFDAQLQSNGLITGQGKDKYLGSILSGHRHPEEGTLKAVSQDAFVNYENGAYPDYINVTVAADAVFIDHYADNDATFKAEFTPPNKFQGKGQNGLTYTGTIASNGSISLSVTATGYLMNWVFSPAEAEAALNYEYPGYTYGGAWRWSQTLGFVYDPHWPWIYSVDYGWRYCSGTMDSLWMWEPVKGWLWVSKTYWPWVWSPDQGWRNQM